MSIQNRPYTGTWVANRRNVVQYTPDFLVYINGDTSLPGCRTCHHNIDLNEFINSVSVDFGVEPGASNCSISMAIPRHYGDSIFRDGNTLLRPALEVHVYFRGYFPMKGLTTPGTAESQQVAGVDLKDVPQYPYYPVFHGVVTSVNHEYSGGFYTASMTCNGMLHFWQHQKMSGASGGSFFGARPVNSGIQTTLTGHPMSGKTPYGIIYSLYRDTAGVADGVGFALQSRTNYGAVNTTTGDPLYAMTLRYWEQRFRGKIYGLRMHGASGQLFTSSQQAYVSLYRTNTFSGSAGTANASSSTNHPTQESFADDPVLISGLAVRGPNGRVLRQPDLTIAGAVNNRGRLGLNIAQLQAFPTDIGSYGQVNLWESTYESKMDIATAVTNVCGYEFFQDADGDLVFKPPLYNLDTSSSRVYRIEPEDIVTMSFTEGEPAATYCVVKGGAFQNIRGVVDESEWGCRSTYVDYKLVAQYGWIESSIESTYYTNAKSAFFFAINHLDRTNAGVNGCTVTIPLRPEIRPGFPVYIPHIDCFYYVTQVSHSFSLGSECTTTLTLTARRRKFLPPGKTGVADVSLDPQLSQVDLRQTSNPSRVLQELDNNNTPRILGFPNVVMAIDPQNTNPMFQVLGFQAVERELTTPPTRRDTRQNTAELNRRQQEFVWQFIRMLLSRTPAMLRPVGGLSDSPLTLAPTNDFLARQFNQRYAVCGIQGANNSEIVVTVRDIEQALTAYIDTRRSLRAGRALLIRQLIQIQQDINTIRRDAQRANADPSAEQLEAKTAEAERIQSYINNFDTNFDAVPDTQSFTAYADRYNNLVAAVSTVSGQITGRKPQRVDPNAARPDNVILMAALIGHYRTPQADSGDIVTDPSGTINSSAILLEQLADRKASLSLTVPGYYRYYSASHPDPDMQGYERVTGIEEGDSNLESTTETVTEDGHIVGTIREVPKEQTRLSPEEATGYILQAYRTLYRRSPPTAVLAILAAQWAEETGFGNRMWNYNFGNNRAVGAGLRTLRRAIEGSRRLGTETRGVGFYQAYGTAQEGARYFVRHITAGSHRDAIVQFQNALSRGYPAAARAYAEALGRSNYFTNDVQSYARNLPISRALRWAENAMRNPRPVRPISETGSTDPASSTTTTEQASRTPEAQNTTVVIRPVTNRANIPAEQRGQYVQRELHQPTNGLRVQVVGRGGVEVVPTNLIYSMTLEKRNRTRVTRATTPRTVTIRPGQLSTFINQCLQNGANGPFLTNLTSTFVSRVGVAERTRTRTTAAQIQDLIAKAVEGITGLRTQAGLIGANATTQSQQTAQAQSQASIGAPPQPSPVAILNITNGQPNNYNPTNITSIRNNPAKSTQVLKAKAAALIREVSIANEPQLRQAQSLLTNLGNAEALPTEVSSLILPWQESLRALFRGNPVPQLGPFQAEAQVRRIESQANEFSPVYPVSDEKGYEHYGSYQYGRGLSIEPGGNYEILMATDPLQFASDVQRERFIRALRSNSNNPQAREESVLQVLREIANDQTFRSGPGAIAALDYLENDQRNEDRTTMIVNGLRNYILSDRDATMKMPVNNVAYQLADLRPMGQQDTCECRGAEADLLLAAYMAGTESFALVTTQDEVSNWVSAQMTQAAESWSEAQSRMRGMTSDQGRRSLLDTVEGWQGIASSFRATNEANVAGANQVVGSAAALGARTQQLFTTPLVPNRGQ